MSPKSQKFFNHSKVPGNLYPGCAYLSLPPPSMNIRVLPDVFSESEKKIEGGKGVDEYAHPG